MRFIKTAIVCVGMCLLLAGSALADTANDTTVQGYGGKPKVAAAVAEVKPSSTGAGSLPFTGTDVTLLLVGGAAIGIVGFGIRRASRSRQ
jgi:hypothetical protein